MSISPCLRVYVNSTDWCIEVTVHLSADSAAVCPHRVDVPYSGAGTSGTGPPPAGDRRAPAATTSQSEHRDDGAGEVFVVEMNWEQGADDER